MNALGLVAVGAATLVIAGCGSAAASTGGAGSSPTPGFGGARGTSGEVAQINGNTMVVNAASGDVDVTLASNVTVLQTRTGTVADLTNGSCVQVTGSKDSTGAVTATSIRSFTATASGCSVAGAFGGGFGGGAGRTRPSGAPSLPARTPNPNFASILGSVKGSTPTSLTIQPNSGAAETVSVPTTVRVTIVTTSSASAIAVGDCVTAVGPKSSSGTVTARSVTIVPPGPNGCSTTGGGFGFGGGGFGGGGGFPGGGGSGQGTSTTT